MNCAHARIQRLQTFELAIAATIRAVTMRPAVSIHDKGLYASAIKSIPHSPQPECPMQTVGTPSDSGGELRPASAKGRASSPRFASTL